MNQPIYESDPDAAPDADFVAAELAHLVIGNRGRLLDARRTPITITAVVPEKAAFELEIGAFEDAGARWELALEEIDRFQFSPDARLAGPAVVAELRRAVVRFQRSLAIGCDQATRATTLRRVATERRAVRDWFARHSPPPAPELARCIAHRQGDPDLFVRLDEFLADRGLTELDRHFTETFVTNPGSGEVVKGHAIVLAELGMCPYRGKDVRDPDLFKEPWSKPRRAEHLIARLAFTHELWSSWAHYEVPLYRAAAVDGPLSAARPSSFISATFSRDVAEEHFNGGPTTQTAVLWRQRVPTTRILMTFLETAALNRPFQEAEAVLIADPANRAF